MSEFNDQTRPSARHRDHNDNPSTKSQSVLKKAARDGKSGARMSVVAGVIAAALGVASLGTAANAALTLPEASRVAEARTAAEASNNKAAEEAAAAKKAAAEKAAADKAAADKAAAERYRGRRVATGGQSECSALCQAPPESCHSGDCRKRPRERP